jgi:hypothetical protein
VFFGRVTLILLLLEMLTTAFAIFFPFEETIFVCAWLKLILFGMFTFTGVALPGIILACCAEGFALGEALLGVAGDALGVGVGVGVGVGDGATPPPLLAGAVDAGVTPATVTDVDSIERAPAPIAFVAST